MSIQQNDMMRGNTPLFVLFFACILLPVSISIADIRVTPIRILLLLAFIPLLFKTMSGAFGKFSIVDVLMVLFGFWIFVTLSVNHGITRIQFSGITVAEMLGGYLLGRALIRRPKDYASFFKVFLIALIITVPFLVFEMTTGTSLIIENITGYSRFLEERAGFWRPQIAFPHAILWGVFCSLAIANLFYIYGGTLKSGSAAGGFALLMTYSALSSGPFLAGLFQVAIVAWGIVTKNAWWTLTIIAVVGYVLIDSLSNRTPITIIIEEFTFSPHTGWYRINIWLYGTQSVANHPIFGIGLNDWVRPDWMWGSSVDNFWLLIAMRHGLVGGIFLYAAIACTVFFVVRSPIKDPQIKLMRTGYLVTMFGVFVALTTVFVWEQLVIMVMFYIGMGSWFFSPEAVTDTSEASEPDAAQNNIRRTPQYTRNFGPRHPPRGTQTHTNERLKRP